MEEVEVFSPNMLPATAEVFQSPDRFTTRVNGREERLAMGLSKPLAYHWKLTFPSNERLRSQFPEEKSIISNRPRSKADVEETEPPFCRGGHISPIQGGGEMLSNNRMQLAARTDAVTVVLPTDFHVMI